MSGLSRSFSPFAKKIQPAITKALKRCPTQRSVPMTIQVRSVYSSLQEPAYYSDDDYLATQFGYRVVVPMASAPVMGGQRHASTMTPRRSNSFVDDLLAEDGNYIHYYNDDEQYGLNTAAITEQVPLSSKEIAAVLEPHKEWDSFLLNTQTPASKAPLSAAATHDDDPYEETVETMEEDWSEHNTAYD